MDNEYNAWNYETEESEANVSEPAGEKNKKGFWQKTVTFVALALVFGLIAGTAFSGVNWAYNNYFNSGAGKYKPVKVEIPYTSVLNVKEGKGVVNEITEVVENAMPSMVAINVVATTTVRSPGFFFGYGGSYKYETTGSGSGIIIGKNDRELFIVTNNHVVQNATQIMVEFIDGKYYMAIIKGTDNDSDLAVISVPLSEIDDSTSKAIKIAVMGDSTTLRLGEPAIAIGNALGYGQSVTVGVISAKEREVQMADGVMKLIQTDAAINPGNSGGALLNIKGEVIGINSVKYASTEVEGIGYAIPISDAIPIIEQLMNAVNPDSLRPFLGINGEDVPEAYQDRFGWPAGVYVTRVYSGSPAHLAGLRQGDIITKLNGKKITSIEELQYELNKCAVGERVTITIIRLQKGDSMQQVTLNAILISRAEAE